MKVLRQYKEWRECGNAKRTPRIENVALDFVCYLRTVYRIRGVDWGFGCVNYLILISWYSFSYYSFSMYADYLKKKVLFALVVKYKPLLRRKLVSSGKDQNIF